MVGDKEFTVDWSMMPDFAANQQKLSWPFGFSTIALHLLEFLFIPTEKAFYRLPPLPVDPLSLYEFVSLDGRVHVFGVTALGSESHKYQSVYVLDLNSNGDRARDNGTGSTVHECYNQDDTLVVASWMGRFMYLAVLLLPVAFLFVLQRCTISS